MSALKSLSIALLVCGCSAFNAARQNEESAGS
jgi:hypothetical protein